jgi:hypothetical protein
MSRRITEITNMEDPQRLLITPGLGQHPSPGHVSELYI